MDPSIIASNFRGRGASYGSSLPDTLPVVYIVPLVVSYRTYRYPAHSLTVTIAPQNTSNMTNISRNETISLPCVLCSNN